MSTAKKIFIGILIAILVIGAVGFIYVSILLGRITKVDLSLPTDQIQEVEILESTESQDLDEEESLQDSELNLSEEMNQTQLSDQDIALIENKQEQSQVTNILLLGVDRRGSNGTSRSDTVLIASLDNKNKRIKLTSLMRDMYLNIPGHGDNRFNSACVKGGPKLVMETINQNFNLNIEHYVLVDFKMFEKIIDALDGVTINMSAGEIAEANDCIAGLNKQRGASLTSGFIKSGAGDVRLTGKQALGYARIRKFGNGDYARTSRQYKVIKEMFNKYFKADPIKQQQILFDVLPLVETNLENTKILELAAQALLIGPDNMLQYRMPADGSYKSRTIRGMNVLLPDIPANTLKLHEFIFNSSEQPELSNTNTKTGTYHPKVSPTPTPTPTPEVVEDEGVPDEIIESEVFPDAVAQDNQIKDEAIANDEIISDESNLVEEDM